ncbi:uncharacterized protein [Triticum aestivum]|uniref:uncharacterized protein n=1 Tax=Triticum aestivum TaxID=4565 RepID=UPI001D0079F1|nr:uncharacterized protein LOC123058369 [Triticum aestivum]
MVDLVLMATMLPGVWDDDQELHRRHVHRLQPPVRAEALHNLAIQSSSPPRPRRHHRRSPPPMPPRGSEHVHDLPRNVGVQEPDATVDDDYYYSGGAYYYVQPADND